VELEMKAWMDRLFGETANTGAARLVELDEFCGPDLITLQRLATLFENCAAWLAPYSDERLNRAFWDLSGNVLFVLGDDSIEWALRQRVISSFEILFREFFAVRCRPVLGHLSEAGSPLNLACYMWWDFDCWYATPGSALLAVMRSSLAIGHVACQESALHGLGHWYHRGQAEAVRSIIDEFLEREPHIRAELREYASSARSGCVL
jgi:hypothetical protein